MNALKVVPAEVVAIATAENATPVEVLVTFHETAQALLGVVPKVTMKSTTDSRSNDVPDPSLGVE